MTLLRSALIIATCLLALGGCAHPPPATAGVTLIDAKRLGKLVAPGEPQLAANATGTLRTWLSLKNLGRERLMIEGRAVFSGDKGQPVEAPSGWLPVFIEGGSSGSLQFNSMSSAAKQVTIELREGNR